MLTGLALTRVLVAAFALLSSSILGQPENAGDLLLPGLAIYLLAAIAMALAARLARSRFVAQLTTQLAADLVLVTLLVVLGGGMRSELVVFYLIPVAGASLMLPTSAAYFTASIAVLVLLADAFLRGLHEGFGGPQLFQAGLFGAALFGLTGVLRLLSVRLLRQERLAHRRGLDLQSQLEINRLVIAQMEQGVIVVDAGARVRANNLAARLLLGMAPDAQFTGQTLAGTPGLESLAADFARWLAAPGDGAGRAVVRLPGAGEKRDAGLRVRYMRPPAAGSGEFVIFLEDLGALEERAQQLKLAAMGRLTASIAHEIRNPLAAISHASALLGEDSADPVQQRLAAIVRENTARLNRLVEDVLRVARREHPLEEVLEVAAFIRLWLAEFFRDRRPPLDAATVVFEGPDGLRVRFEAGHLRQVLFNLVDNALRFASGAPGCVRIVLQSPEVGAGGQGGPRLWVLDDGPGVPDADRAAVFEPFFTTHSRGTGLGLYLAREFCIANHAELAYEKPVESMAGKGGFVLRLPAAA
jgi:two-component system sensor histidine kinase PilS (NtrC family)